MASFGKRQNIDPVASDFAAKKPRSKKRRLCLCCCLLLLLVVIAAVAVPLAILLPRKNQEGTSTRSPAQSTSPTSTVSTLPPPALPTLSPPSSAPRKPYNDQKYSARMLLPLYVNPSNGAWDQLYRTIETQPDVGFTIIINPHNGPSNITGDEVYKGAIQRLNRYDNTRTVGYVPTNFTLKNIDLVIQDVNEYARWHELGPDMAVYGIFFDEAPADWTPESATYMKRLSSHVKNAMGIKGADKLVIRNPGRIPDRGLSDSNTDISVIFEESYQMWDGNRAAAIQNQPHSERHKSAVMVHHVPMEIYNSARMKGFLASLNQGADYVFVTSNGGEWPYNTWDGNWSKFADVAVDGARVRASGRTGII